MARADDFGRYEEIGNKNEIKYDPSEHIGNHEAPRIFGGLYQNKNKVAVKVLPASKRAIAKNETKALRGLSNDNIIKLIGEDEDNRRYFIALELCDKSFTEFNEEESVLHKETDKIDLFHQLCKGVHYLHDKNLVHGNIKPSTILLVKNLVEKKDDNGKWTVKISNFSRCATLIAQDKTVESSSANVWSHSYKALETLDSLKPVMGKASDIFSLGMVLYYMYTSGKNPFGEDSLVNIQNKKEPDLTPFKNNKKMEIFTELLSSMLSHDMDERPTIQDILAHPVVWSSKDCVEFIQEISDHLKSIKNETGTEEESSERDKQFLKDINRLSKDVCNNNWVEPLQYLIDTTSNPEDKRYKRRNDFYELLKLIRDWRHHYGDSIKEKDWKNKRLEWHPSGKNVAFQNAAGSFPDGFWRCFVEPFPNLIAKVYSVTKGYYKETHCERLKNFFEWSDKINYGQSSSDLKAEANNSYKPSSKVFKILSSDNESDAESDEANETTEPEEVILRPYQEELTVDALKGENCMIVAPTGCGKTAVALKIIQDHLSKRQNAKVLFIVPKVELAIQQHDYIRRHIGKEHTMCCLTSRTVTGSSPGLLMHRNDISVLTPAFIVQEIERKRPFMKLEDVTLMILDECHHTSKEHPYKKLMDAVIKKEGDGASKVHVVGLTASPGIGRGKHREKVLENLIELLARLNVTIYPTCIINEKESLKQHMNEIKEFYIHVDPASDGFSEKVSEAMGFLESELKIRKVFNGKAPNHLLQAYENWAVNLQKTIQQLPNDDKVNKVSLMLAAKHLQQYYNLLFLHSHIPDAWEFIKDELVVHGENEKDTLLQLLVQVHDELDEYYRKHKMKVPLVKKLVETLQSHFTKNKDSQCIIFVPRKAIATSLQKYLNTIDGIKELNVTKLTTAHQQAAAGGMTSHEQKESMQLFKIKESQILVATSVAEEGLDIPSCNLVITYNYLTNEIGRIQRKGRGRSQHSKVLLLALNNTDIAHRDENNKIAAAATEFALRDIREENLDELKKKVKAHQDKEQAKLIRREKDVQKKYREATKYNLLCGMCGTHLVNASELRHILHQHKVISGDVETLYTRPSREEEDLFDGIIGVGTVHCAKCKAQLGVLMKYESRHLKCLQCKKIVFQNKEINDGSQQKFTWKKWADCRFDVENCIDDDEIIDPDLEVREEPCEDFVHIKSGMYKFHDYEVVELMDSYNS